MEDLAMAVNTPKKVFPGAENENHNETEEQPNISFNVTSLPGLQLLPLTQFVKIHQCQTLQLLLLAQCSRV